MVSPRTSARARPQKTRGPIRINDGALEFDGRRLPLLSGAMHYWRLDPSAWAPGLEEIRRMGFGIVETYIPWGVHEIGPGEFDFGQRDPRNDLLKFIDLAEKAGLYVFLRPGPHINAELTFFGLPERIIYDKQCQARSPSGQSVILPFPPVMFPVPSYASDKFHEETGRWYDAVGKIIAPKLYPEGPVVLLQVDNEAAFYFRNGPYCQDYHPDAVALWKNFLKSEYHTIEKLREVHRVNYESFETAEPPTRFGAEKPEDLPRHLDWARFAEWLHVHALERFKNRMAEAGMTGVPTVHNVPLGDAGQPINIPGFSRTVDLVGLDYYHARREYRTIKRRTLYLSGTLPLAYAPELGVGAPAWFTPLAHEDSLFCAMTALAYGLRGFNLYMAMDRDRWYGAPIDVTGTPRIEAGSWKHLLSRLHEVGFHALSRRAEVGLVMPREYSRLSRATHLLGAVSPSTLEAIGGTPVDGSSDEPLGFEGPVQSLWWRMLGRFADALSAANIPYVFIDGDADPSRFDSLRVVISPSYEYASTHRWRTMCAFASDGGTVIYGPAIPNLDEHMKRHPFEVPKNGECVLIDTAVDAERVVVELMETLMLSRPFAARTPGIETSMHEDSSGPRVLFVINPTSTSKRAEVALPCPMSFIDAMSGESFVGGDALDVHVPRMSLRMLIVDRHSSGLADAQRAAPRARARRSA